MSVAEKLLSAAEFALLPDPDDGARMELEYGRVAMAPPPGAEHGRRAARLSYALMGFVNTHALGDVLVDCGFVLDTAETIVRAPDVAFVASDAPRAELTPSGYLKGGPTLAVEVVSPGNPARDVDQKAIDYLSAGSRRVWVVRSATRTVTVYREGGDAHIYSWGDTLTSADAGFEVEGFALAVADLFA